MPETVVRPKPNPKNRIEHKTITLSDVKLDSEGNGSFTGYASVWNVTDLQGDIVTPGAFRKTIKDNDGLFVLLDQHDFKTEIGFVRVSEDNHGLHIDHGQFYIDSAGDTTKDVAGARSTYNKMRFRHEVGKPLQFSIGYRAINPKYRNGKRILEEIALAEISTVTFPAAPEAVTTDVKSLEELTKAFGERYARALDENMPWMALDIARGVIMESIFDAAFEKGRDREERMEQLQRDLEDFASAVLENVQSIMNLEGEDITTAEAHLRPLLKSLESSTSPPEPSAEEGGHSEDEAAGEDEPLAEEKDALEALVAFKSEVIRSRIAPVHELVGEIRRKAKESHG